MCDRIIENLKTREEPNEIQGTEEELENSPVRKSSFPSRFICALFSVDKDEEIETNQAFEEKTAGRQVPRRMKRHFLRQLERVIMRCWSKRLERYHKSEKEAFFRLLSKDLLD